MLTPSIGMISPTVEISERAQRVARELDMQDQVSFHVANLKEGLETARMLEGQGVEVLIARRGTAELIRKNLTTPMVPITITVQDMAQALREAKLLTGIERPRIGLFTLPAHQANIDVFREFMEIDLHVYNMIEEEEYMERLVDRAIADKMHVIVAGSVVTVMAHRRGFPNLLLDSGSLALRTALVEAHQVAYARMLEKTQAQRFRTVVDSANEGILLLDAVWCVQMANPAARRILGRTDSLEGKGVQTVLPSLNLAACMDEGGRQPVAVPTDKGTLIITVVPTRVGEKVRGAVLFFQPAESLTRLRADVHRDMHSRGFTSQYDFSSIAGASPQIRAAVEQARLYARGEGNILLIGETGTGKELFAHAIHQASPSSQGPFVAVNCAALPSTLLESELFGYEEGAFTGAARKGKPGMFELAHRGTIFLDEVSELDKGSQLRLLRVLQERCTMRLGGHRLIPIEVRVIAASNRNLRQLVNQKAFRDDLFFRLNVLPLFIPPLRSRQGDVVALALEFWDRLTTRRHKNISLEQEALRCLEQHFWPGNVRELLNVIELIALAAEERPVNAALVASLLEPERLWDSLSEQCAPQESVLLQPDPLSEQERILSALRQSGGHRGKAAMLLGCNRATLYRKIRQYGITAFAP